MINAYRAFLAGEFVTARDAYQQLIARDPGDADAWYGLGEAWFHDTAGSDQSPAWTHAIRAFRRTLALDPEYALAYEHVQACSRAPAALSPTTHSCRPTRSPWRSASMAGRSIRRSARPRCRARANRGAGDGAELGDDAADHAARPRGDGGRVRGGGELRRRAERGGSVQADGAVASRSPVRRRADPLRLGRRGPCRGRAPNGARHRRAAGFPSYQGAPSVIGDIAAAANVFAYQGDLSHAAKAIDLADQVRQEVSQRAREAGRARRMASLRAG